MIKIDEKELARVAYLLEEVSLIQAQAQMEDNWAVVTELRFIYEETATYIRSIMLGKPVSDFWDEVARRLRNAITNHDIVDMKLKKIKEKGEGLADNKTSMCH